MNPGIISIAVITDMYIFCLCLISAGADDLKGWDEIRQDGVREGQVGCMVECCGVVECSEVLEWDFERRIGLVG